MQTQIVLAGRIYESSKSLAETGNSFWGKLSVKCSGVESSGAHRQRSIVVLALGSSFPCQNVDFALQLQTRQEWGNADE